MQRVPDELVQLAVQHGLGVQEGGRWLASIGDLQRLQVIAAPAPDRPRPPPPARPAPAPPMSRKRVKAREDQIQRDDRRSRLGRDVRGQRERVAAIIGALQDLYDAQGAYLQVLDDQRATDTQVLDAHRVVERATDAVRRVQGG